MKFMVSFTTSPSQGRNIRAGFISSVFKENVGEPELDKLICQQTYK